MRYTSLMRRLERLEPDPENWYDGLLVKDVIAEIEEDAKRLLEAEDPDAEYAKMLMETAAARGGELSFEEALRITEDINKVVYEPWLSKEHAEPGGKQRAG